MVARAECPVLMVAGRESQVWPCEHAAAAVAESALLEFLTGLDGQAGLDG